MKKVFQIFLMIGVIIGTVEAQLKVNNTEFNYNNKYWMYGNSDLYIHSNCKVIGLFVTGAGKIAADESSHGASFSAGINRSYTLHYIRAKKATGAVDESIQSTCEYTGKGLELGVSDLLANFTLDIWSVADPVRVAKANYLAWKVQNGESHHMILEPDILSLKHTETYAGQPGISLTVSL